MRNYMSLLSIIHRPSSIFWILLTLALPLYAQQPERLHNEINSSAVELMPCVTADGKELYYVRAMHNRNMGHRVNPDDQDIYVSQWENGEWGPSLNIGPPINTYYANAHLNVTPDGNMMIVQGLYIDNGRRWRPGFSYSLRTETGWSMPRPLIIDGYYNMDPEWMTASQTADGQHLLLAIEDSTSLGGLDLYVSHRLADSSYTHPHNLGPDINTPQRDVSAFLAPDGRSLYFATEGRGGAGSFDLFVAYRLDDSWTRWSTPQNLGAPLNTPGFEGYPSLTAQGDMLYYVHNDETSLPDLWRCPLPDSLRPDHTLLVRGTVRDATTRQPLTAEVRYHYLQTGREAGVARSRPGSGQYQVALPAHEWYALRAEATGYYPLSEQLDLITTLPEQRVIERDLLLQKIETGVAVPLRNVFFAFDSTSLQPQSRDELDRLLQLLASQPALRLRIEGHTDNQGTADYNLRLSQGRADAVRNYLLQHGIAPERIQAQGLGDTQPVLPNTTTGGRAANRRVAFVPLP